MQITNKDIAHLRCTVRGIPRPTINWKLSEKTLTNADHGIAILEVVNTSTETLTSNLFVAVMGNQGQGEYLCTATNELGMSSQTFVIQGGAF